MELTIQLIFCTILLAVVYMDFKERVVPLYLLFVLFIISLVYTCYQADVATAFLQLALNTGLIVMLLVSLLFYYRLRQGSFKGVVNHKLGVGDMVFWVTIAPLFSLLNFILYFISSLLAVLILVVIRLIFNTKVDLIPLAGYQALFLLFITIGNALFFNHNFSIDLLSFYSNL